MAAKINLTSRWMDSQGNYFQIIHIHTDDSGHEWVHYRRERDSLEFSCWTDSFLLRFTEAPHDSRSKVHFGI